MIWIHSLQFYTLLYLFLVTRIVEALDSDLTDANIDAVNARLTESAQASWELGTRVQTILERSATSYSVFSRNSLPPPSSPDAATLSALQPLFDMANNIVYSQSKYSTGPQPLMPDGSAGDPASLVVCVLIAHLTREANGGASKGLDYLDAAKSQIDYLLSKVPRTLDGAISHRVSELQLWSDFVYMVPPSLAYYGMTTENLTMIVEAYNQIKLYRDHLWDPKQRMWKHVLLGPWKDPGCWSTGNGWAAAGMLRVYATIINSQYAPALKDELANLAEWVHEIHEGMYKRLDNNTFIFTNYADRAADSPGNFPDAASTAFLASTVYRAAQFLGQTDYLDYAEKSRLALSAMNPDFSYSYFTKEWDLYPVVDPHTFSFPSTTTSPEGQAFVVQMHHAWEDWTRESTASRSTDGGSTGGGSTGNGTTGDGATGDGMTGDGTTGGGSTGDGSTGDGSTGDKPMEGGPTVSVSTGNGSTGSVLMWSGSTESDTGCAAGVSVDQCTALLGSLSSGRSTAHIGSKTSILVVLTILGLVGTFV